MHTTESDGEDISSLLARKYKRKEGECMNKDIIYNILDRMIDALGEVGVDVSYFPEEAKKILEETSIKISEL